MSLADALTGKMVKENPPIFFDLLDTVRRRLESKREKERPDPETVYRVSSIVYFCAREEVLKHRNAIVSIEEIDNKTQRIFDIGTSMHSWIQNEWFGKWGILWGNWICLKCSSYFNRTTRPDCCGEVRYEEFFLSRDKISGHVDAVLDVGEKRVVEIKTCNSKQFQLVTQIRKDALEAHKDQLQLYMWLTGFKTGHVFYFEKDESQIFDYVYKFNPDRVQQILDQVDLARVTMTDPELELPSKICKEASCTRAKRCPVRKLCFIKGDK